MTTARINNIGPQIIQQPGPVRFRRQDECRRLHSHQERRKRHQPGPSPGVVGGPFGHIASPGPGRTDLGGGIGIEVPRGGCGVPHGLHGGGVLGGDINVGGGAVGIRVAAVAEDGLDGGDVFRDGGQFHFPKLISPPNMHTNKIGWYSRVWENETDLPPGFVDDDRGNPCTEEVFDRTRTEFA
eukprot:CAMPEP_0202457442 /NCGR_PEP_ID=MMETSP1360-20130828/14470_1 /ASSEMBLY_ACC=CAM_ASM_000848 /TAXON_ID=515479 /ORGANISM="Licmophora paradoxa, Strain CCMP2313" /LENGTH=182 /DNA_ID=CAMNT_0049077539 /DNA_START=537 /DNA_END=1082 /DNA_ORIENTATION=+